MSEIEKPGRTDSPPSPGDFPLGSPESRAAARVAAERFPAPPLIVTVLVDSAAPCLEPGPIKWGTVLGVQTIFERGADESESDFVDRLAALAPIEKTPFCESCTVTIHAETHKPELPIPAPDPQVRPTA